MSDLEKINIYVPQAIGNTLLNDIQLFEIFKKDGMTPNKNSFLNTVLKEYYNIYNNECQNSLQRIINELKPINVDDSIKNSVAQSILHNIILPFIPKRKGKNSISLSLKPINETESIIQSINDDLPQNDYLSQFLCRMYTSYCNKPLFQRERIVFNSSYTFLLNACKKGLSVSFSTIWNKKNIRNVIPYKVIENKEEMYNYLLCGEINQTTGVLEPHTYRLNRISGLKYSSHNIILNDEVINRLELMADQNAQFSISEDLESCILLTENGAKSYNRIYHSRPPVSKIEKDGDNYRYYFHCSKDQLFVYFRRFGADALVIHPSDLYFRMKEFYSNAVKVYQ